jgi:hypothetical protein
VVHPVFGDSRKSEIWLQPVAYQQKTTYKSMSWQGSWENLCFSQSKDVVMLLKHHCPQVGKCHITTLSSLTFLALTAPVEDVMQTVTGRTNGEEEHGRWKSND